VPQESKEIGFSRCGRHPRRLKAYPHPVFPTARLHGLLKNSPEELFT